jgi:tetratricopeptide (TPR) repeat protein
MAIKHDPTNSNAYNNRGNCLYHLNRKEEALVSYDMAIKHNPTYSYAYNNRGLCLYALNRQANTNMSLPVGA